MSSTSLCDLIFPHQQRFKKKEKKLGGNQNERFPKSMETKKSR